MSKATKIHTKIQWTNRTWNPLRGCTRVSEGCRHCYAETLAGRFCGPGQAYEGLVKITPNGPRWTNTVRLMPEKLVEPLTWRTPAMVFVNSTSDLFHPDVPDEFIAAVFAVMAACPQHTFQVLTKRPERMPAWFHWLPSHYSGPRREGTPWDYLMPKLKAAAPQPWPLPNVWIGVSAEDQATADSRIPPLLACPAAVRFVSYEPALGPVDWRCYLPPACHGDVRSGHLCGFCYGVYGNGVDWIIVGGESGPGARPFDLAWAYDTVGACKKAGVAVFCKQMGARPYHRETPLRYDDRKGGDMDEWPEDLRVREFPSPSSSLEGAAL